MIIDELLQSREITKYRLAVDTAVSHITMNDICGGKTKMEKCGAETVCKLAKVLCIAAEFLVESGLRTAQRERLYGLWEGHSMRP